MIEAENKPSRMLKNRHGMKKTWRQREKRRGACTEWRDFPEGPAEMDMWERKGEALSQVTMNLEHSIFPSIICFSLKFLASETPSDSLTLG